MGRRAAFRHVVLHVAPPGSSGRFPRHRPGHAPGEVLQGCRRQRRRRDGVRGDRHTLAPVLARSSPARARPANGGAVIAGTVHHSRSLAPRCRRAIGDRQRHRLAGANARAQARRSSSVLLGVPLAFKAPVGGSPGGSPGGSWQSPWRQPRRHPLMDSAGDQIPRHHVWSIPQMQHGQRRPPRMRP